MTIIHIVDGIVEFLKRVENSEIRHVRSIRFSGRRHYGRFLEVKMKMCLGR